MITLYHRPKTRSSRFIWLLEELGQPYEIKEVTLRSAQGGSPDPANPHPHGKVPAISDNGEVVWESPAIALYLTDKYPTAGIGPTVGDPTRGAYLSWLVYYGSALEPALMSKFMNVAVPVGTAGWVELEPTIETVVKTLSAGPYLLGEKFSAADILYASTFAMFGAMPIMPKSPVIDAYVKRCLDRPAHARAQAKEAA
ncbi:MAG TPA: glutathione S-transferase family protein [Rhizomicrobium sp.]|jgi:glutathione S-transferase